MSEWLSEWMNDWVFVWFFGVWVRVYLYFVFDDDGIALKACVYMNRLQEKKASKFHAQNVTTSMNGMEYTFTTFVNGTLFIYAVRKYKMTWNFSVEKSIGQIARA